MEKPHDKMSIFFKQSELNKIEQKLKKEDLLKIIPKSCYDNENTSLQNTMTEWRWRILKIGEKYYTEISMKHPNNNRIYMTKFEKWVEKDIDTSYDQYVIKKFYYYTELKKPE